VVTGSTNQTGVYKRTSIPPGKYYVLAGDFAKDKSLEATRRLSQALSKAAEVELGPNGTALLTLQPKE
jgi:hypothetical protein